MHIQNDSTDCSGSEPFWLLCYNWTMTNATKFENPEPETHHKIALWAANCAEHVLPIFEAANANDKRPRLAITALREWVRGERTMVSCRQAAFAAHDAAREATDSAAVAAARAAGQAVAVAHMYTHSPHAADYAAKAAKLAAPKASAEDTWAAERQWQWGQLEADLRGIGFPNGIDSAAKIKTNDPKSA